MIIHWLGEMFDPALDGYWGHKDHGEAMNIAVDVITAPQPGMTTLNVTTIAEADLRARPGTG